jgi:DNA (cytosine-5)-methyltransferase 1
VANDATIRAVDLFCGAGGLSWGLVEAIKGVAIDAERPTEEVLDHAIDLVGVNHWNIAIETHERNHPWARHFHDDVGNVDPSEVFDGDDPEIKILSGGIECVHWSIARGGKPVDAQKRMPAWDVLTWIQKLRPENVLLENVKEFEQWGPIDEDGTPTRTGETFEQWVNGIHSLGYSVDWAVLNAADYGDATSRDRLFVLARREHRPEFPDPSHSKDGEGDTELWRTAAEIIDWSEPGESIWTRSRPLVENTMQRIAEGIRRHGDDRFEPYAEAVAQLGKTDVEAMQQRVVPPEFAPLVADLLDQPFLVSPGEAGEALGLCTPYLLSQHLSGVPRDVTERTVPTITSTSRGISLSRPTPFLLGQHGGAAPRAVDSEPVPTIASAGYVRVFDAAPFILPRNGRQRGIHSNPAYGPADEPLHTVTAQNHDGYLLTPTLLRFSHGGALLDVQDPLPTITTAKGGVFALARPYLVPFYGERSGQAPRVRDLDRPLQTVPATKVPAGLARPYLVQYHGQSGAHSLELPTPTLTARDSLALCVPECYPWGLDVRFRMLQPRELAAAQGFPSDYDFAGTKTETVEQIGNAVPVNLARQLVESLLRSSTPSLTDYLDDAATVESPATGTGGVAGDD